MAEIEETLVVDYDAEHDVLRILNGAPGNYTGQISDSLMVDLAANGAPVAIELLDAAKWLAPALEKLAANARNDKVGMGQPSVESTAEKGRG